MPSCSVWSRDLPSACSTCSLNPIENEAVVAAMLRTFGPHTLRLVDVSSELPELHRRPGLSTWRVWYRAQWQASWEELQARFPRKCPPFESLFPPTAEEAREMHLERCLRLLPHHNDGGGFFVAVFEKLAEHAAEAGVPPTDEPNPNPNPNPSPKPNPSPNPNPYPNPYPNPNPNQVPR